MTNPNGIAVAIIGSGNIGTDLMIKVMRQSKHLKMGAMVGIDPASDGLARAARLGVPTTHEGLDGLLKLPNFKDIRIVFDATSAGAHARHNAVLQEHGIQVIDLTPAAIGPYTIPVVNLDDNLDAPNINMVTCGGQATVPVVAAISAVAPVSYAEIVATIGSLAIPWMKRSRASGETAALVLSGNAGVGATFPFSGAFFVLLAAPTVVPVLSSHDVVATLFVTGAWMVAMRLVVAYTIVHRRGVGTMAAADIRPLRQSFGAGWTSLLVLAAVAVPVLLTTGPGSDWATDRLGGLDATDAVPLLMWLPVVMLVAGLLVERRALPHGGADWWRTLGEIGPKLGLVGVTMVSAFAASEVLARLGLGDQLAPYLQDLQDVPPLVAALVVGLVLVIVAGPLNTTSTLAAVGPVAFAALTAAGIPAHVAFASVIVWASSEGCSPPGAAPLYVAAGIADINPARIFLPVALYYLVPTYLFGVLMAVGVLWIPG